MPAAEPSPFFTGEYELSVDDKGRLLIPSDIRKKMDPERDGESLMVVIGQNDKPWFYPENYYTSRIAPKLDDPLSDPDDLDFILDLYSGMRTVTPDKQGRILLPDDGEGFSREAIGKEVTLVGVRDHFQVWPRADWKAFKEQTRTRRGDLRHKARQKRETDRTRQAD